MKYQKLVRVRFVQPSTNISVETSETRGELPVSLFKQIHLRRRNCDQSISNTYGDHRDIKRARPDMRIKLIGLRVPAIDDRQSRIQGGDAVHPGILKWYTDAKINPRVRHCRQLLRCRLIGGGTMPGTHHSRHRDLRSADIFDEVLER